MFMIYQRTRLRSTLAIPRIITVYYFEFGKHYAFQGESHDFWEMLYVDKGDILVTADDRTYRLTQGSIIFHKPNEFHKYHAQNEKAPNVIVVTFDCRSAVMRKFEHAVIRLDDEERNLLAKVVQEAKGAFEFPFQHPLVRRSNPVLGAEQMVRAYLESFLLHLLRRGGWESEPKPLSSPAKEREDEDLTASVIRFLETRIGAKTSLDELAGALGVSKTRLKETFKQRTGQTIMDYFAALRIDKAKLLIRESANNMTEIASMLGYSSVHVFTKAFKRATGMSPTEYAKSVKGRIQS